MKTHPMQKFKIIIIGAGTAGLTCARRLLSKGIKDVLILEAQNRIGGRIWTVPYENSVLELGAQWLHGEVSNPLYEYCRLHNLLDNGTSVSHEGQGVFCSSEGKIIEPKVVDDVIFFLENIKHSINHLTYEHAEQPLSMYHVFSIEFERYLKNCNDSPRARQVKVGLFEWFLKFEVVDNGCSLQDLTTLGYAAWVDCPGQYHNNMEKGYYSFIDSLLTDLPPDMILSSKPVKCINWSKTQLETSGMEKNKECCPNFPVIIECADGQYYAAQHAILTSSIGYIQSNLDTLFSPSLPDRKRKAFQYHGFGTVNKIYLVFEKPFWEKEIGFQLVWLDNTSMMKKFSTPETKWAIGITGFDLVIKQPFVLVGWIGGHHAQEMEKVNDDLVGKTCAQLLRCFLKHPDISDPINVIRSSWYSNDFVKGSYSCRSKQFYDAKCTVSDLSDPLYCDYVDQAGKISKYPIVTFAGEAMDREYFSSVHGAFRSGQNEADRLIRFLSNEE